MFMRSDRPAKTNQIWLAAAFLRTQGNKMEHLTLQPRPKTTEKEKCLPAGDGLPFWSEVPLFAKLPVYPNLKGSYKLCTTSLCEPVSIMFLLLTLLSILSFLYRYSIHVNHREFSS